MGGNNYVWPAQRYSYAQSQGQPDLCSGPRDREQDCAYYFRPYYFRPYLSLTAALAHRRTDEEKLRRTILDDASDVRS